MGALLLTVEHVYVHVLRKKEEDIFIHYLHKRNNNDWTRPTSLYINLSCGRLSSPAQKKIIKRQLGLDATPWGRMQLGGGGSGMLWAKTEKERNRGMKTGEVKLSKNIPEHRKRCIIRPS